MYSIMYTQILPYQFASAGCLSEERRAAYPELFIDSAKTRIEHNWEHPWEHHLDLARFRAHSHSIAKLVDDTELLLYERLLTCAIS
jgi:hypothetical protein